MKGKILVIIPSLNEEKAIGDVISGIKKELGDCDVLVIDGYSRDNTVGVSLSHGAEVIQVAKEFGIAAAVEAGILVAYREKYGYLVRIDADGQHPPSEIKKILAHVISGEADFVIGSRFLGDADYTPTFLRNISIQTISFLLKALYKVKITDCTSGCQIYNSKVIEFFAQDNKFEYSEIRAIWMARKAGFVIKEEFINMAPRTHGVSSFSPWIAFFYMFKNIVDLVLSIPISLKRIAK
ncbi:MAG: glycosyltransferase family 2 protein [Nitrospinae bacterium]|nr:glycosyltransferase family 2 protein [Nitrospinota bacterium]